MNQGIQSKWREGYVLGEDCIAYGDGRVVMARAGQLYDPNTRTTTYYWSPLCDTTLASIEKYCDEIWTEVDIFHGSFEFEGQKIVFGDGGMGNEGYIASIGKNSSLNWSVFFTISNPIVKAEMKGRELICYGDTGFVAQIYIDELTRLSVYHEEGMP